MIVFCLEDISMYVEQNISVYNSRLVDCDEQIFKKYVHQFFFPKSKLIYIPDFSWTLFQIWAQNFIAEIIKNAHHELYNQTAEMMSITSRPSLKVCSTMDFIEVKS